VLQVGRVTKCFDSDALKSPERPFPLGYVNDTSLVKISHATATQEFKAPPNTQWLSRGAFQALQLHKTQISFLENDQSSMSDGKNIPSESSNVLGVSSPCFMQSQVS